MKGVHLTENPTHQFFDNLMTQVLSALICVCSFVYFTVPYMAKLMTAPHLTEVAIHINSLRVELVVDHAERGHWQNDILRSSESSLLQTSSYSTVEEVTVSDGNITYLLSDRYVGQKSTNFTYGIKQQSNAWFTQWRCGDRGDRDDKKAYENQLHFICHAGRTKVENH